MSSITEKDDYLHQPDDQEKWRESYYFNWVDKENEISGFTTIGLLPNARKREFVFILFYRDALRAIHYQELPYTLQQKGLEEVLSSENLSYTLIHPLNKWKIHFHHDSVNFNLIFETRFSLYDFGRDSSASWYGHFESSGKVTGIVELLEEGVTLEISGYGQRDKSWGYRDWHEFDKWYAGHIQFENFAVGFRKDYQKNQIQLSGFWTSNNQLIPLKSVYMQNISVENDEDNTPLVTIYQIETNAGKKINLKLQKLGEKTSFRFAREFSEGYTELFEQMVLIQDLDSGKVGTGMAEFLRTHKNL